MLKLGFVSAILPDRTLGQVLHFASREGFDCVEVMCWPPGQAERRYAGVTHIDVVGFNKNDAARVKALCHDLGVSISALGYYPNPLSADLAEAKVYTEHLKRVIKAASLLGLGVVNTFVGRDHTKSIDDNWPRFLKTWSPLLKFAADHHIRIGIENCPMSFSKDEWPGGKNLAVSPAVWRRMYQDLPDANFGLNFDPSHFILQHMDYLAPLREFKDRLFHVHAKDVRIDIERRNQVGVFAHPNLFHTPKLPGMGDVDWNKFFSVLTEVYSGPVCVEVEDRAFEGSLEARENSLRQSRNYLRQFIA